MNSTIIEAGFLLSYAFEKLNTQKVLYPFLTTILPNGEHKSEIFQDISFEHSIPKLLEKFNANTSGANAAIAIYPAEIETENSREPLIVIMIKEYPNNDFLTVAQFYETKEGQYIPTHYELLDYDPLLTNKLKEYEVNFNKGFKRYEETL